jgi:PAS domain S-box-containing protein
METSLFNRVQATLLALATAALFVLAVLNLLEQRQFPQPDDGVWWGEAAGGLHAEKVLPDKPGQRAGIQVGDLLTGVSESPTEAVTPVTVVADLERALYATGPYGQVYYTITRDGIPLEAPIKVIPEPLDRSLEFGLRIIGLIYLIIGFYVLFRRWGAPRATHFYLFCLVSFALYALKYTSKLDTLDWIVFWTNVVAEALQPALFLHFALSFPEERFKNLRRRWLLPLIYAPGAGMLALWLWSIGTREATKLLLDRLYQIDTAYDAVFYVAAALLFLRSYSRATTPLLRQQLKWVTRGTLLAVLPFTFFYAVPYLLHLNPPQLLTNLAGLSLVFLPLTFAWAIVRYRLMDTDLIFKRGVAYTLATALILGGYFGIIALIAEVVHERLPETMQKWAVVIAILVTAAVFDPVKRRIQSWVDRAFDRHRYDYRRALVEFGRGLGSQTDLQALLNSIVEQLPRTLLVARVAIFLAQDSGHLRLAASHGLPDEVSAGQSNLALGFLNFDRANDHSHIFLENAQAVLHLPRDQQRTAALLDLNYYLPCRVAPVQLENGEAASRTIAVIGLGRTLGGDFLSSEDVELLESLASYIGIALQNASLYARLEEKIVEFERLKEFNENIVESINVGIFAIDLNDRIESWNAQMEAMYAFSRAEALGQELRSVFPLEFIEALEGFGSDPGVHHLYKFRLTTRAGELRTANIAIAPLLSRDFVPVGRTVLVDDITERVTLETQLAQAD